MTDKNTSLTKICSHCGQLKPMAAFLEFSDEKGTYYGSVCSTCRKTVIEEKRKEREAEEATTSRSGFKIDAKSKVQKEFDKRKFQREQTEQDVVEKEKKEETKIETQTKKQNVTQDEKKHRKNFLQKRSYQSENNNKPEKTLVHGGSEQNAKEAEINLAAGPILDTQVAGKLKFQSSVFNQFKAWLGGSAPIVSAAEKAKKSAQQKPDAVTEFVKKHGPKS